ncbi:MAG: Gfo/Idh/MocA family protein [Halanaerobiales bacterium]
MIKVDKNEICYGMVGGALDSFMGDVHRQAVTFDGKAKLVSGCFSRDYEKNLTTGEKLNLNKERIYKDFREMAAAEADRIDFVSIVLPNYAHYEAAKAFLEKGINVYCEKPLTFTVEEAEELKGITEEKGLLFGVNYSYSGYPMVKQAREMVRRGDIGEINMVMGEYPQGYLLAAVAGNEDGGISTWRVDPEIAGRSNCVGDIGSHIENTVSYITGLEIDSLAANLRSVAGASELDDNAEIMIKYKGGATGLYWSSQVAIGHDNGLKVRIYGSKGSIIWEQEKPDYLTVSFIDKPRQIVSRGRDDLYPLAAEKVRLPAGHPEGLPVAFANMYLNFISAIKAQKKGEYEEGKYDFPTVEDGLQGVKFINACVDSSKMGAKWVKVE